MTGRLTSKQTLDLLATLGVSLSAYGLRALDATLQPIKVNKRWAYSRERVIDFVRSGAVPTTNELSARDVAMALGLSVARVYVLDHVLRPTLVRRGKHQVRRIYDRGAVDRYHAARRVTP